MLGLLSWMPKHLASAPSHLCKYWPNGAGAKPNAAVDFLKFPDNSLFNGVAIYLISKLFQ